MRRKLAVIALPASLMVALTADAAAPSPIVGRWQTDDGKAIVEVAPCGAAMCGQIARFLVPEPKGGARDDNNPDKALRARPLLGVQILSNLKADGKAWKGRGYSPEDGRNFNATVTANGTKLNVRGCVTIICRTVVWTRAR
jgi:uncharacterized protein (DUF2147 family)